MIPWLQIRPGQGNRRAVTAITWDRKNGPFYEFPKKYRDVKFHSEHRAEIEKKKPTNYNHAKMIYFYGPTKKKYYDEKNQRFWFGEGDNKSYLEEKTFQNREYSCK